MIKTGATDRQPVIDSCFELSGDGKKRVPELPSLLHMFAFEFGYNDHSYAGGFIISFIARENPVRNDDNQHHITATTTTTTTPTTTDDDWEASV